METLRIDATQDTPSIVFDITTNTMEISGKSYPDNVLAFYNPALTWLNKYASQPGSHTKFIFKLDYFNTATAKIIFDLLNKLHEIRTNGNKVDIVWYYKSDDDEMKEAGEGYKNILETDIDIISY